MANGRDAGAFKHCIQQTLIARPETENFGELSKVQASIKSLIRKIHMRCNASYTFSFLDRSSYQASIVFFKKNKLFQII